MTPLRAAFLVATLVCPTTAAHAGARYRAVEPVEVTEGKGCYYYRGREFCGNYCYWEVNGKRYCQQRIRDAHSQAPVEIFVPEERMK